MFYVDDGVGISFFDDGKKKGAKHNPSKYITYEIFICVKKRVSERERERVREKKEEKNRKNMFQCLARMNYLRIEIFQKMFNIFLFVTVNEYNMNII